MKCWHCNTKLIWGGDHDTEDNDTYSMVTNLSCPKCHCFVEVYYPNENTQKEYKKDFLEEVKKEKKELEESYQESIRQTKERTK